MTYTPLRAQATDSGRKYYQLCCSFFRIQLAVSVVFFGKSCEAISNNSLEHDVNVREQAGWTIVFQIFFIAPFAQQNDFRFLATDGDSVLIQVPTEPESLSNLASTSSNELGVDAVVAENFSIFHLGSCVHISLISASRACHLTV